jgi:hypothetical protein
LGEGSISQYMEKVIQRIEAEDVRSANMKKECEKKRRKFTVVWIQIRLRNPDPDLGGQK